MRNLDLDDPGTWDDAFRRLVYGADTWRSVLDRLEDDDGMDFLSQLTCRPGCLRDDLASRLRSAGLKILLDSYDNVIGYHGCRLAQHSTYRQHGILPSNTALLIEYARQLFQGIPGFDEAVGDLGRSYLSHNDGKIGLLLSARLARHDRNDHTGGSELIRCIANRLGHEAKQRYIATGTPALIKCCVPVEWLDIHTTFPMRSAYVNEVLACLIRNRKWPRQEWRGAEGGYLLLRAVPARNILEFIDMTEYSRWG
jgi:hypothetical protein